MENRETIFIEGVRFFEPREGAPDFVLGSVVVTPNQLIKFLKEHEEHSSEYNGETQFNFNMLKSSSGSTYFTLNTFKPKPKEQEQPQQEEDDLPF